MSKEQRKQLENWAWFRRVPVRLAERARMIFLVGEGPQNQGTAQRLGRSRQAVARRCQRFHQWDLAGIEKDVPPPGHKPKISAAAVEEIVRKTKRLLKAIGISILPFTLKLH